MDLHDARERTGLAPASLPLFGGDLLVIAAFLTAGELSHGVSPVSQPLVVAETMVPFLVGWSVAALLLSLYDRSALTTPLHAARLAAGAWLGAANVGLLLRGSPYFQGGTSWPFPLVITGVGVVALVTWRVVAARVLSTG
jgi:nucleoside recognition membrane protein YjiH